MAEELQSLLDKISEEGVKKADAEAAKIITAAQEQAKTIQTQAQAEADALIKEANEKAEGLQKRAEAAVRQAARDILLELQAELQRRMTRAVGSAADAALTPEFMTGLIKELAAKFADDPNGKVTVLSAVKDTAALEKALSGALLAGFHANPEIFGSSGIKSGMEVSFKDGQVYFDFTGEAVTELVSDYIGPRLATLLAGK